MTGFLASVLSADEAQVALANGADIIDLKNPLAGALGGLPLDIVGEVVKLVGGRKPVSATVGDLPMTPQILVPAVQAMAATGVDVVKIGLFDGGNLWDCLQQLGEISRETRLVLVMFADMGWDCALLPKLAQYGLYGVMLDTARKNGQSLTDWLSLKQLSEFVVEARIAGLVTGLAGSLKVDDIALLESLGADYLGFRGALCGESLRINELQPERVRQISGLLHAGNNMHEMPHEIALQPALALQSA